MRSFRGATLALASLQMAAEAQDNYFFVEGAVSTALHDRGEQISGESLEFAAGVEIPTALGQIYGAVYQLKPIGDHGKVFDSEVDYSLGLIWEATRYVADISVNWLTFPGEEADSSIEFAASLELDVILRPTISAFYDARSNDTGLEVSGGPEWSAGEWSLYTLGRAGTLFRDTDGADLSYVGMEIGAARFLTDSVELDLFIRVDAADEQSFAADIDSGMIVGERNSGISSGLTLSLTH